MTKRLTLDEQLARGEQRQVAKAAWDTLRRKLEAATRLVASTQPFDDESVAAALDALSEANEAVSPALAALGLTVEPLSEPPAEPDAPTGEE